MIVSDLQINKMAVQRCNHVLNITCFHSMQNYELDICIKFFNQLKRQKIKLVYFSVLGWFCCTYSVAPKCSVLPLTGKALDKNWTDDDKKIVLFLVFRFWLRSQLCWQALELSKIWVQDSTWKILIQFYILITNELKLEEILAFISLLILFTKLAYLNFPVQVSGFYGSLHCVDTFLP